MLNVLIYGCSSLSDIQQSLILNCMSGSNRTIINENNCFIAVVVPNGVTNNDLNNLKYLGCLVPDVFIKEHDLLHALRLMERNGNNTLFIKAGEIVTINNKQDINHNSIITPINDPPEGIDTICGTILPNSVIKSYIDTCKNIGIYDGDLSSFKYFLNREYLSKTDTTRAYKGECSYISSDITWCDDKGINKARNRELLNRYFERNPNKSLNMNRKGLTDAIID